MTANSRIRADIEAELEFEPSIDAANIGVTVKDGVATLTGHVDSYAEKVSAERAASRVKSVRAIAGEIEVRLPFDVTYGDEEIAHRAVNILEWGFSLPTDIIRVKVSQGWLTLTGQVEWQYQKQSIAAAMGQLCGVRGVSNMIEVMPELRVGDVRQYLLEAYRRNADLDDSMIKVAVKDGKITLSGKVRSWGERITAENAAWSIASVTEVVDDLLVA